MSDKRYLFVFTAPYKVHDPAALQRRAEHRPAHVQRLMGMWDDGTIREYPLYLTANGGRYNRRGGQSSEGRC